MFSNNRNANAVNNKHCPVKLDPVNLVPTMAPHMTDMSARQAYPLYCKYNKSLDFEALRRRCCAVFSVSMARTVTFSRLCNEDPS